MYSKNEIKILIDATNKLEPEARLVGESIYDPDRSLILSIAISLKRIADCMEKDSLKVNSEAYEAGVKAMKKSMTP